MFTLSSVIVTGVAFVTFCGVPFVSQNVFVVGAGGVPVPAVKPLIPVWPVIEALFEVKLAPFESPVFTHPTPSSGESQICSRIDPMLPDVPGVKAKVYVVTAFAAELATVTDLSTSASAWAARGLSPQLTVSAMIRIFW